MLYYIIGDAMKYEILDLLKNKDDYISGQDIAKSLNVSRTAVWKNINKLRSEGYNIVSVTNRGYRLIKDQYDILNENEISYKPLYYIEEAGSTNNIAKDIASKSDSNRLLVVCNKQTSGKGRLGRSWDSQGEAALCMSLVLTPDIMPQEAPQLTLVAGIACCKAIYKISGLKAGIKWPNDVIINGKKAVGILTEMSAEMERVRFVVIGVGINVNTTAFPDEIKDKATSIYIETGKHQKRSLYADGFMEEFNKLYSIYSEYGFKALKDKYNSLCINVGQYVKTLGTNPVEGKAIGVDDRGQLIIETSKGVETVLSGEVSLRLKNNKYI